MFCLNKKHTRHQVFRTKIKRFIGLIPSFFLHLVLNVVDYYLNSSMDLEFFDV